MEVGGLNETVTVDSASEIIQTQSAAVSTTIDTNQILKLPDRQPQRARLRDHAARA